MRQIVVCTISQDVLMEKAELTGMPMKDFFDWTTSPSGILAVAEETTESRN